MYNGSVKTRATAHRLLNGFTDDVTVTRVPSLKGIFVKARDNTAATRFGQELARQLGLGPLVP